MRILPPLRASSRDVPFGLVSVKVANAERSTSLSVPSASTQTAPVLIAAIVLRSTFPPDNASMRTSDPKPSVPDSVVKFDRSSRLPAPLAFRDRSTLNILSGW